MTDIQDGAFTFRLEKSEGGHVLTLETQNSYKDFSEMVTLFLLYVGNHNEELVDSIIKTYYENMQENDALSFVPVAREHAQLQA